MGMNHMILLKKGTHSLILSSPNQSTKKVWFLENLDGERWTLSIKHNPLPSLL